MLAIWLFIAKVVPDMDILKVPTDCITFFANTLLFLQIHRASFSVKPNPLHRCTFLSGLAAEIEADAARSIFIFHPSHPLIEKHSLVLPESA